MARVSGDASERGAARRGHGAPAITRRQILKCWGNALKRSEYALGHALLASLRVEEVVTTDFDDLYEQAAEVTFEPRGLRVLPWQRVAPNMPWLLKLHGGVEHDHVVFTREDYLTFEETWRPLASIVQTLLMTRHMLFGYSLSES